MRSQLRPIGRSSPVEPVLQFLRCRTPTAWVDAAVGDLPTLLLDHASLELKAAQQAQKMIWRYGPAGPNAEGLDAPARLALLRTMSRLAREELRHFEHVLELLATRDLDFEPVNASRYARELHAEIRPDEPARCIDTLVVGAIIEARSCERFYSVLPALERPEPELARFYASLLRSEARHFQDYLALAERVAESDSADRAEHFLTLDAVLTVRPDTELRFHSGPPS
jgi:tRNA-(ms[2]io[6]A)-hydroxylase